MRAAILQMIFLAGIGRPRAAGPRLKDIDGRRPVFGQIRYPADDLPLMMISGPVSVKIDS